MTSRQPRLAMKGALAPLIAMLMLLELACTRQAGVVKTAAGKPLLGPHARIASLKGDRFALAIVLGKTRDQDSLTFGEWIRAAYRDTCPSFGSTDVDFRTSGDSHFTQVAVWWKQPTGTYTQPPCGNRAPPEFHVAAVRTSDGAVVAPVSGDPRSVDWLARFSRGEPPPSPLP